MEELNKITNELDEPLSKKLKKQKPIQNPTNIELEQRKKAIETVLNKFKQEEQEWLDLEKQYSNNKKTPKKSPKKSPRKPTVRDNLCVFFVLILI